MRISIKIRCIGMLLICFSVPVVLVGCGGGHAAQAYDPANFRGEVDASLPKEQQAKQVAVGKLMNAFVEGAGDATSLAIYAPGISFKGTIDDLADPAKQPVRWDFNGPPVGNDVPVSLYFDDQGLGRVDPKVQLREDRTYVVTRAGNQFSIKYK